MEMTRFLPHFRAVLKPVRASISPPSSIRVARQTIRCLHCGSANNATLVNHPSVAGPPPQPPQAPPGQPGQATARKQRQAEILLQRQASKTNSAKPTAGLQKRFWKDVSVRESDDGLQIVLDSRPVRTSTKQILTLPHNKRAFALAIAMEWDMLISAQQAIKHDYIPLTSLASRAIDIRTADAAKNSKIRDEITRMMMRYLATDTLLCWAPEKSIHDAATTEGATTSLRQKQIAIAEPIIAYLKTHVFPGVEIYPILEEDSIMPRPQPEMTQQIIKGWLLGLPAFELAALERGVLATKSLLVAIRLLVEWSQEFRDVQQGAEKRFGIAEAAEASTAEVTWQTGMWGEVEDTHDVDKEDLARQLGSVILLVS